MAGFPDFLVTWVGTQSDLTTAVGERVGPWQNIRKDTMARIAYFRVSGGRVNDLAGPRTVQRERWQVNCFGSTPAEAQQVATLVAGTGPLGTQALDGYRGTLAGIAVLSCILDDDGDRSEPLTPGDDKGSPCISLDFNVSWRRT